MSIDYNVVKFSPIKDVAPHTIATDFLNGVVKFSPVKNPVAHTGLAKFVYNVIKFNRGENDLFGLSFIIVSDNIGGRVSRR